MLDTGATHRFICAQLARPLSLPVPAVPGPAVVGLGTPDTSRSVPQPAVIHLALGEAKTVRAAIDMMPLDLGPDLDTVLGTGSATLPHPQGRVAGSGPQGAHRHTPSALSFIDGARRGADRPWRLPPHGTPCGARCTNPGNS